MIWLGAIAMVGGVALGIFLIVRAVIGLVDTVDDYERVPVATGGTIVLDEPGDYRVFYERPGISDDDSTSFGGSPVSGFYTPTVTVTAPDGTVVPLRGYGMSETYSFGSDREGKAIGRFDAPVAGSYEIDVDVPSERTPVGSIAIGDESPLGSAAAGIGIALLVGGLVFVLGIVLLVVGIVKRSRSKKANVIYPGSPLAAGWAAPPVAGAGGWGAPPAAPGWAPPATQQPSGPPGWSPPPAAAPGPLPAPGPHQAPGSPGGPWGSPPAAPGPSDWGGPSTPAPGAPSAWDPPSDPRGPQS